jgi:pilus assembly protein CpaC
MLKVRVAELTRSAPRRMGVELDMSFGEFTLASPFGVAAGLTAIMDTTDVDLTLNMFASSGYSKILAEPNLVTMSGQTASFIAGGEFAVPTVVGVDGVGAVSTNFRSFGTQIQFTPTVIDKDRIRLQVSPTVSSPTGEEVDGIPILDTKSVTTTVELREGQWFAIAGLIQDSQDGTKARAPIVGDIPFVDLFFSRRRVERDETELIILVSPELVHPLEPEEAPLILPGMEVTEPTDWGFFIEGRYEGKDNCHHRSTVWPTWLEKIMDARRDAKRQARFQRNETYYVQGAHGFSG